MAIVAKAFHHGFYWPTTRAAAEHLVKHCNGCQRFKAKSHLPALTLKTIPITWPFAVWGVDMVGPFKTARGGSTHLLVIVDKLNSPSGSKHVRSRSWMVRLQLSSSPTS